jgi:hypothetical protein
VWTGHRTIEVAPHPRPQDVRPVRISAGAFGEGAPMRDLVLSPDHAVFVDGDADGGASGVLVPVRYLVNGATITPLPVRHVTYWHVELPAHDVLLAEGLPAESYLDTGNRHAFEGGGPVVALHPEFALGRWAAEGCAPLVTAGPALAAVRARLLARAVALGFGYTVEPDLHLLGPGGRIDGVEMEGNWRFAVPCGGNWRLRSRAQRPAHLHASHRDHRLLGVAVASLALDGRAIGLENARLGAGWHAPEDGLRWTDGDAALHLGAGGVLEVAIVLVSPTWERPGDGAARRRRQC